MTNLVEEHYKGNFKRMVNLYSGKFGNSWEAEDVVQEGYSRAIKYFDSFDDTRSIDKWINRIMYRSFIDYKNAERPNYELVVEDVEDLSYNPKDLERVVQFIHDQKDSIREVLRLYYIYGHGPLAISQITGMPQTNVSSITTRFRGTLIEFIEGLS